MTKKTLSHDDENVNKSLREELEDSVNELNEAEEEEEDEVEEDDSETEDEGDEGEAEESEEDSEELDEEDEESDDDDEGELEEEVLEAPTRWTAEQKEAFAELPTEAQEIVLDRHKEIEGDYTKKTQELAEQRKQYDPVKQVFDKWGNVLNQMGMPVENVVENLINADYTFRNGTNAQKQELLQKIVNDYAIDLDEEHSDADPQIAALQQQVSALTNTITTGQQQQEQAGLSAAQSAIESFKAEKTDEGTPKFPHFDTLQPSILLLVQSGQAGTGDYQSQLESAYDQALWMNTETRKERLSSEQSRSKKETIKRQTKATAKAKKKAAANKRGKNSGASKPKKQSLRADLKEQLNASGI